MLNMTSLSVDAEKCTACRACELTCSFAKEGVFAPYRSRIRIVRLHGFNVPIVCVNCAQAPCIEVCPTGAVYRDRAVPVVRINEAECIGCWECVKACPFGAAAWDDDKDVAIMCDLCGGEPACVASCIYGALRFEPEATMVRRKRRATAEAIAACPELVLSEACPELRRRVEGQSRRAGAAG